MPAAGPHAGGAGSLPATAELAELAREAGLRRVALLAWRDIDDAEAGGSELHAHEVATRWAAAGIAALAASDREADPIDKLGARPLIGYGS